MKLLEWVVIGLAVILALNVLFMAALLVIYTFRNPPGWWIRRSIPDHIPDDWGGDPILNRPTKDNWTEGQHDPNQEEA
jgi:hypothetical protein